MTAQSNESNSDCESWIHVDDVDQPSDVKCGSQVSNEVRAQACSTDHASVNQQHEPSEEPAPFGQQNEPSMELTSDQIQLTLRPHIKAAPAATPSTVLGMASLRVPSIGNLPKLSQLDVITVVDRSGSMRGQRLDLVKKAVRFISKQLRPGDRFAIVSYSDNAAVDLPLTLMDEEGQGECSHALDGMEAKGSTNLSEGLLWGLGELNSSDAPAAVMMLFTDGLANRGTTQTDALVEAIRRPMSQMGRKSRAVFTFGFGAEHNAQTLFLLADAGTGCYYYVDRPQAIGPSFADCLGGMLSVVAQDVTLALCTKNGTTISNVHADFAVEMNEAATEARIKMRDLSGDAEKEVLFDLSVPAVTVLSDEWLALECIVSYVDAAGGAARTAVANLTLTREKGIAQQASVDPNVEAHRCRLLAAKAMERAALLIGKASPTAAIQLVLSNAVNELENSPARTQERVNVLIADLGQCLDSSSDARTCEKWCSSYAFAHKHQVSNRAEGSEYRNELQQRLAEAARREIGVDSGMTLGGKQDTASKQRHRQKHEFQPTRRGVVEKVSATTIQAGAVRKAMRIVCRGVPGEVQEVTMSKTGKHGHAKVFFTVLCDDGVTRQDVVPASHNVELPAEA